MNVGFGLKHVLGGGGGDGGFDTVRLKIELSDASKTSYVMVQGIAP
jgi:hypothetical protein